MIVAEAVGRALVACGVDRAFGVVGSGNFHVTNAMVAAGAPFVATRHEGGGATAADAYARMTGRPTVLSVHQGCGLTNAMTGIAEAAKSRTPLVVVAAEVSEPRSNFFVDQPALAAAVGAVAHRVTSAASCLEETVAAVAQALHERRTVLLNLPLPVQAEQVPPSVEAALAEVRLPAAPPAVSPSSADVERLADALRRAQRPVFVAGRGARSAAARDALVELADSVGALLATSAVAKGLFNGSPWNLDVSGGFSSPLTAELVSGSDLIVGWGCALNMWTMRHGALVGPGATVVQVDDTAQALGAHRALAFGVLGDVAATARATQELLTGPAGRERAAYRGRGWHGEEVRDRIARDRRWQDVPFDDLSGDGLIDPRRLSIELDAILPAERVVAVDSGNFMGYPAMFLDVPDEQGMCFTQAFQSIGLGLATAIGAALAQPHRLTVAALGDGGALMAAAELDTVRRLGLDMLVVVYNDDAYGAEVHHFGGRGGGVPLDTVVFPETDIAAVGRGYGYEAVTVRSVEDLAPVREWAAGARRVPMLLDAKVTRDQASWWLEEAFRGH